MVVTLPVVLLSAYASGSNPDSTLTAYLTLAQMIMNVALVYAVIQVVKSRKVGVKEAYYRGTAPLVRVVLTAFVLLIVALLFILGLIIVLYGILVSGSALSLAEALLIMILALIPMVPGAYLIARTFWALFHIFESDDGPLQAVRSSWLLTSGQGWRLLGRCILLALFLLAISIIPLALLSLLQDLTGASIFGLLIHIALPLMIVPTSNIYLYRIYRDLTK
jgi:hypothetical protein